jgi:hypothetical protein
MWDIITGRPADSDEILKIDDLRKPGQVLPWRSYSLRFVLLLTWCVSWSNSET